MKTCEEPPSSNGPQFDTIKEIGNGLRFGGPVPMLPRRWGPGADISLSVQDKTFFGGGGDVRIDLLSATL